jgi:hypothetical protein
MPAGFMVRSAQTAGNDGRLGVHMADKHCRNEIGEPFSVTPTSTVGMGNTQGTGSGEIFRTRPSSGTQPVLCSPGTHQLACASR